MFYHVCVFNNSSRPPEASSVCCPADTFLTLFGVVLLTFPGFTADLKTGCELRFEVFTSLNCRMQLPGLMKGA